MSLDVELERLREMDRKRTPGPWLPGEKDDGNIDYVYCDNALGTAVASVRFKPDITGWSDAERAANRDFIAAAPEMMSLLERMWARIGELEKEREWRPMEDAPHRMKLIVRYKNKLGKNRTIMARYYDAGTLDLADWVDDTGDGFAEEGWYEECENNETIFRVHEELLGWQYVPKPPEQKP